MNEMTPQECAEILNGMNSTLYDGGSETLHIAANDERKLANGELVEAEKVRKFLESQLSDAYYCTRVWSAWNVGTMSENDFEPVDVDEIMSALMDADMGNHIMGKDDNNAK